MDLKVARALLGAPDRGPKTVNAGWQVQRGAVRTPRPAQQRCDGRLASNIFEGHL